MKIDIVGGEIRIKSSKGNAIFRAVPVNMPMDGMHQKFMGEMMNHRAGAEVSIGLSDKYSIINYSENMNLMVRSVGKNRMKMIINSTDSDELYGAKESSFWLNMSGEKRMQAMMYIANFSERVVDVVVEDEVTPTSTQTSGKTPVSTPATPGFEIAIVLLAAGIAYKLGRKS